MGEPFVLKNSGEIEINNIFVKAIETFHDNQEGTELGKNNIFVIDSEGIRLVHMGDFGERKMKDDLIEKLGSVDILLIPAGNTKIMTTNEAIDIIKKIEPKIVIPMHYQTQGSKNNEEVIKKFIKEIGIEVETMEKLNIKKANLSDDEDTQMQLIVLQN
jgi:L-ascorbate metabolism protein UlaG (beta-lactamase superfamily)